MQAQGSQGQYQSRILASTDAQFTAAQSRLALYTSAASEEAFRWDKQAQERALKARIPSITSPALDGEPFFVAEEYHQQYEQKQPPKLAFLGEYLGLICLYDYYEYA